MKNSADAREESRQSPFYAWLDNAAIRQLVRGALALPAGERLVLMKALVPGLVEDMGEKAFDAFLEEVRVKARRYAEAMAHPGEGAGSRQTASEPLGGPTPRGEARLPGTRQPHRVGGRALERKWE